MKRSSRSSMASTAALALVATISACAHSVPPVAAPASMPTASISDVGPAYHLVDQHHPAPASMPTEWVWLTADGARAERTRQLLLENAHQKEVRGLKGDVALLKEQKGVDDKQLAADNGWWAQNKALVSLLGGVVLGAAAALGVFAAAKALH